MWYYEDKGQSVGPVEESELMAKLQSRSIPLNAMVWTEGFADWKPASEAFPSMAAVRAPVARPQAGAGVQNPYQKAGAGQAAPQGTSSYGVQRSGKGPAPGLAITSLVLGILGLPMIFCYLGPFIGIPAVICGHLASKKIAAENLDGKGMALAGKIMGYISIVFGILIYILIGVAILSEM